MAEEIISGYGKRPLWQWITIYAVLGIVVYGLIYYFILSKKGGYNTNPSPTTPPVTTSEATFSTTATAQKIVTLTTDGFFPKTINVKAGTEVTWSNQSGSNGTVSSDPHPIHTDYSPLNLGNFPNEGTLSLTFDKPGTYGYHNHLSPAQTGTIVVQ